MDRVTSPLERNGLKCLNAELPGSWEAKLVQDDCRIYYVEVISPLERNGLKCLNAELPGSWEAKLVPDDCRIYYVDFKPYVVGTHWNYLDKTIPMSTHYESHTTQTSNWLPPRENWDPGHSALPYGWELAVDKGKKNYFINHLESFTTRDDPRDDPDYIEPPKPRDVELVRDAQKGFGFVAGSEKPVVVRFVTEGGPSVDKLMPGDQIIRINGQDVKKAPREYVIDLVRSCKQAISLTVCQPYTDNNQNWLSALRDLLAPAEDKQKSARKSALLTAAKKDRLKKNPSKVRFAEEVIINGASVPSTSPEESYVTFMPNVLKVFLENGQTKSFKYDSKTTVRDVVGSLQEKLNMKAVHHFNLVLQNMKSHMPGHMTLLQDHETISEIASRPGARHFRCLFRVVFVPKDSYDLLKQDPIAFEYFYMQCVNDVIKERFANELKPDLILRLSALHIQQHALSNNMTGKINIKTIEKEFGFEKFVPPAVRDNMKVKDLRKVLAQSLKLNQNLTAPGQKQLTALQAKLHYLKIVSELKTFGSRVFMVTLLDKKTEAMVLVGPKAGISLVTNIRFYTLSMLADFSEVQGMKIAKEKDNMIKVEMTIKGEEPGTLNLGLLKEDAMNFVGMVNGYYKIYVDPNQSLIQKNAGRQSDDPDIPAYESKHTVIMAPWSYPEDMVTMYIGEDKSRGLGTQDNERMADFSMGPPAYAGNKDFIQKLKQDLGIKEKEKSENGITEGDSEKLENKENVDVTETEKEKPPKLNSPTSEEKTLLKTVIEVRSDTSAHDRDTARSDRKRSGMVTRLNDEIKDEASRPKRKHRSPTPGRKVLGSKRGEVDSDDDVPYENIPKRTPQRIESITENSDSDSGVGGETDKQTEAEGEMEQDEESLTSSSDQGCLTDSAYSHMTINGTPTDIPPSPDPENASFMGPFDTDQLPLEVQQAVYDPRLFSNHELYIDPDIIDLTLLPPFPPTDEELEEEHHSLGPLPRSPVPGHHPRLLKTMSVIEDDHHHDQQEEDSHARPQLQKSASVGYCPDFLDDDIDEFINTMTLQPPPTNSNSGAGVESMDGEVDINSNSNDQDQELDGRTESFTFDNSMMSKTIDLGALCLGDQLSSLVIPPPPQESSTLDDIPIVPPVESVKDRRKRFEDISEKSVDQKVNGEGNDKSTGKVETGTKSFYIGEQASESKQDKNLKSNESPASVSEKLNELLKSLSFQDAKDEPVGKLRRTSSLRLSKCSSLDFLSKPSHPNVDKHSDLVTGSVRVRPPKIRSKLNVEQAFQVGNGTGHLKPMQEIKTESTVIPSENSETKMQRAHSYDILTTDNDKNTKNESDTNISEGFASLKAKLQSYRDSLLNRSLRRKEKKEREGIPDFTPPTSEPSNGLTRSSSFSSLLRNSIRRSSRSSKEGRSSSLTREGSSDKTEDLKDRGASTMSARDRKIWNTLTTSRANFRPNAAGQSQGQKQKAGPIKALSSVFDRSKDEKNHSGASTNQTQAIAPDNNKPRKHTSPDKTPKRMAPDIPKGSPPYIPKAGEAKQTENLKDLTDVYEAYSVPVKTQLTPKKSKDDSEMQHSAVDNKDIKLSPYATVGKMWRPMSMSSASAENENDNPYRSFNNFDALREMSNEKGQGTNPMIGNPGVMPNGHISLTSLKQVLASTTKELNQKESDRASVSEKSFAVLKEKASASHSNSVKQILETVYTSEDFVQATNDVDRLLSELKQTLEALKSSRIDKKPVQFNMCKDELQSQVRQFVTDAKLLVSNATQTKEKLAVNMNTSMHSLGKIFLHGQATMFMMEAIHQAQHLGSEIMRVANAYKSTLNAAHAAVGKPLSDPHMRYLMRQATNLASLLSTLLKSLKTLEQK